MKHVSSRLKNLVDESVTLLGEVIGEEMGEGGFRLIESVRSQMAASRRQGEARNAATLRRVLRAFEKLSPARRLDCAKAFTLMLELMNACENAYRNHSIRQKKFPLPRDRPDAVIYVLTAHPTEARSPENIWVFHEIQKRLTLHLWAEEKMMGASARADVKHLIHLAWRVPVVRSRKPRVQDEAEHIFSTALREETLGTLLRSSEELAPLYIRSWVGGDKDGHPGVNAQTFRDSLKLSRRQLHDFFRLRLAEVSSATRAGRLSETLALPHRRVNACLARLKSVGSGDGAKVGALRRAVTEYSAAYKKEVGAAHPALVELERSLRLFPGFVVPLEFRESSDMLAEPPIRKMLLALKSVARGGDPRWYVRGFIISMTQSIEHIRAAAALVQLTFGAVKLPVIPLFEQAEDLAHSPGIIREMLSDPALTRAREKHWGGYLEMMVGYSDSSKQSGVLPSRLQIAEVMHTLDRLCRGKKVVPVFFQGSGGSVDRGGGSIPEQTAWWPAGALRNYKVTIQGEMVERSFASAQICWRQVERIVASAGQWKKREKAYHPAPATRHFAALVAEHYRERVGEADFLKVVEAATPYSFLDRLRIGSRPSKRKNLARVSDLRAIPWVLCWTQTRVLFPTWWGVGSAWQALSAKEKKALRGCYERDPVFGVFVNALAYTMAKVELTVWDLYLERSNLGEETKKKVRAEFYAEARKVNVFLARVKTGNKNAASRGWLFESIALRSPMIHPLNLLQLIALRKNERDLLRVTVTGIANGMVATG